jgi:ankyrin repeat protein
MAAPSDVEAFAKACAKACAKLPPAAAYFKGASFKVVNGKIELEKIDKEENTVFHTAACENYLDPFSYLESIKGDKNPKNKEGITPLHIASSKGHLQICELLMISLKRGDI